MRDIWGFLLQTLTVSGAAVLLLVVKGMFRDKLSPRWQFAVWGVLAGTMLVPAGLFGRYVLVNWPVAVETLKSLLTGDYTLTMVSAPIPLLPKRPPSALFEWLYVLYLAGVLLLLGYYLISYIRLRLALRRGVRVNEEWLRAVGEKYDLPVCPAVEVEGLSSAFVCGVFFPVLALPAGVETEDKVLLHELLHLKHRDAAWGVVICLLRCLHWCNPLIWYCADRAGNDLEALCDQRVLERLEGEERREYGHILLSMANEKYARAPGTSSMANGGKNIRRRIESIARFKRYPAGMALVSVCVAVVLANPLWMGTRAGGVSWEPNRVPGNEFQRAAVLASSRTNWCTTHAGALDAYAKSLLAGRKPHQAIAYRAICAPMEEQGGLAASMEAGRFTGLPEEPKANEGYHIYNLELTEDGGCTALVVIPLEETQQTQEENQMTIAFQPVRVEKEGPRYVVLPQGELQTATGTEEALNWGTQLLPAYVYTAEGADFRVEVYHQKTFEVDNTIRNESNMSWFGFSSTRFDMTPKPNAEFEEVNYNQWQQVVYTGAPEKKSAIRSIGLTTYPLEAGEERPDLCVPGPNGGGSSTTGEDWAGRTLEPGWADTQWLGGGGHGGTYRGEEETLPACYAADLYINGENVAELTLMREEGTT